MPSTIDDAQIEYIVLEAFKDAIHDLERYVGAVSLSDLTCMVEHVNPEELLIISEGDEEEGDNLQPVFEVLIELDEELNEYLYSENVVEEQLESNLIDIFAGRLKEWDGMLILHLRSWRSK